MITALLLAALLSLTYEGTQRDRVSDGENALHPDGNLDGTFTVVNTGGARTITKLYLSTNGGQWDTVAGNVIWSLGVASGLDAPLYNAANESVNLAMSDGSALKLFASDCCGRIFTNGRQFTLTATFSDGSTDQAVVVIGGTVPPEPPPPVVTPPPPPSTWSQPFFFNFDHDFVITFAPGRGYNTKQYTLPDGSNVIEFQILK